MSAIPFENFDVVLGRSIGLEPEKLFDKLVRTNRGGYCFELNGLFLMALQTFGFDARALLARVHKEGIPSGRGHQLSLVSCEGETRLADVGFGSNTPRSPLKFVVDQPMTSHGQTVRLVETRQFGTMLQLQSGSGWEDLYSFDLEYVCPGDIEMGNFYTSTSPKSFFRSARVAALPLDRGSITLLDEKLTITRDGQVKHIQLVENEHYIEYLEKFFGIRLDVSYEDFLPLAK
jgi:N-hydroxyarylamine O-acetyltransferase